MEERLYVIGHKNPDTDSIASSYAYAELKKRLGYDAIACRLGTLNEETKFATRFFDVEAPLILNDARTTLKDIKLDVPVFIKEDATCNEAYQKVLNTNTKTLFVVDDKGIFKGIVSMGDLASLRLADHSKRQEYMRYTSTKNLAQDLKGTILNDTKRLSNGLINMVTKTSIEEQMEKIKDTIAIVTDNIEVQRKTIEAKAMVIIIGFGKLPSEEIIELAKKEDVAIISSSLSPLEMIRIIYETIPLSLIMTTDPITYSIDEYADDVAAKVANTRFRAYPIIDDKGMVVASLSRFHLFRYPKKKFILVDHSSKVQTIDNIDKAEIKEIIDHHHIGNIETDRPIYYRNECCGCTSTIIYSLYLENGLVPDRKVAGMMLSAIISDTLYFHSETTTPKDISAAKALSAIARVDLDEYAKEFLASSVNLKDGDVKELLTSDLKQYHFKDNHIAVGQTNYQDYEDIQLRLKEFTKALEDTAKDRDLDLIVMMFTHVLAEGTMFLYYGKLANIMPDIIETTFDEHSGYDHHIMSRKQQLIPAIAERLGN